MNMTPFCGAIEKKWKPLSPPAELNRWVKTLKINILDHDIPEDPAEIWLGMEKFTQKRLKIARTRCG